MTDSASEIQKLLEEAQRQNERDRNLWEAGVPLVGVFYYIDGEVYARPRAKTELEATATTGVVSYSTHFSYWRDLRHLKPEWNKLDDSYFPRGRVVYDKDEDIYYVIMDKCVPEKHIKKVLEEFNLTGIFHQARHKICIVRGQDPETGIDHYKCAQCDPINRKRVL